MQAFIRAHGIILPMNQDHVDTDAIIPQRWLVTVERDGLADGFMGAWRYDEHGQPRPECVLNQPAYQGAAIVLARENYGCGSSREHAVWAHQGYGIRAIVAASYGPIFHENCLKNGLLPVTCRGRRRDADGPGAGRPGLRLRGGPGQPARHRPGRPRYPFEIDAGRRQLLLEASTTSTWRCARGRHRGVPAAPATGSAMAGIAARTNVTIKDIATRLKLSHATVSRALADHPKISAATKASVREAAQAMGYVPNGTAQNMRTAHSPVIG